MGITLYIKFPFLPLPEHRPELQSSRRLWRMLHHKLVEPNCPYIPAHIFQGCALFCLPTSIKMLCSFKVQKALLCVPLVVKPKNKINVFFYGSLVSSAIRAKIWLSLTSLIMVERTISSNVSSIECLVLLVLNFFFTTVLCLPRTSNIARTFSLLSLYDPSVQCFMLHLMVKLQLHF